MIDTFSSFLIVWYTNLPALVNLNIKHFYFANDACNYMEQNFNPYIQGSANKPKLFGLDFVGEFGLNAVPLKCAEIKPSKKNWKVVEGGDANE